MGTTVNVVENLGTDRLVYKQVGDDLGIVVGPRTQPKILTPGLDGYNLGLYDPAFVNQLVYPFSGAATYYVRIVPYYDGLTDTAGDYLTGIPTAENTTAGVSFSFLPVGESFPCSGYQVWAGTVSGTLYYQGLLEGRYNTVFTVGTTWSYVSSGATLSPKTDAVPQFVSAMEIFQSEGAVNTRAFLGGGEEYSSGYAKVSQTSEAAALSGGTSAESTYTNWTGVTAGAMRLKMAWERIQDDDIAQKYYQTITDLDFSSATDMDDVAAVIQVGIRAQRSPILFGGTSVETTIETWQAITDGSFDLRIRGAIYHVTGLNFSGDAAMANVAATIQAGIRTATGGSVETCVWDSAAGRLVIDPNIPAFTDVITNGDMSSDTGWTLTDDEANVTNSIGSGVMSWVKSSGEGAKYAVSLQNDAATDGKKYLISLDYDATGFTLNADTGNLDMGIFTAADANVNTTSTTIASMVAAGTGTIVFTGTATATGTSIGFDCSFSADASEGTITFDNFIALELESMPTLSYLDRNSAGTGTDVSVMIDGRSDSLTAVLDSTGKPASLETVTWSTDHFIITSPSTGDQYRIGYLEAPPIGTDISGSAYMDCDSTGNGTVTWGQTALRTVLGNGTAWGDWSTGMQFRLQSESFRTLIGYQLEPDVLHLDADYVGDAFNGWQEYVLQPYSDQVYISDLSDPFTYLSANILQLPITSKDRITAIKRVGLNIAIFMEHHVWLLSSVDITAPRLISNTIGAPDDACIVDLEGGLAFYSGEDFMFLQGGRVRSLDSEGRMRDLLNRISESTLYPHGVFYPDKRGDVAKWWFGIDDSLTYNIAICMDVKRGNWWLENHKDAQCSVVVRDANDVAHIITGSTYDDAHSIPAFTMLHGSEYMSDAASGVSMSTRHGTVNTIAADVETAGYLTCGTSGAIATFQAVTSGYFRVEIDGYTMDIGPLDFSGAADFDAVAVIIQAAIRAETGALETVVYSTDHFVITSGTLTNQSNVGYLLPYLPTVSDVDLSDESYMNGREGKCTQTLAVSTSTLNLLSGTGAAAALSTDGDGEEGCFVFICDTNLENGQLARVVSNDGDNITVTPAFSTAPVAGWYWYMGAIIPSWTKWMDFGSSQHKQKLHGIAITVPPGEDTQMNLLAIHSMQNLSSTVRETEVQQLGGTEDTVNTRHMKDREATQHGLRIFRPSSTHGLKIEDITVTHRPSV